MSGFTLRPPIDARLTAPLELPATSTGHLTTEGGNTLDDGSGNVSLAGTLGVGGQATFTDQISQPVNIVSSFLTATLAVAATTATTITSTSLGVGTWLLAGAVSWEATTTAEEVAAWFQLGTAVGTLTTTTDISTTTTLGAGEACTKPVGIITVTTAGTINLVGEAAAALTATNTGIYGPANTATGIIAIRIG